MKSTMIFATVGVAAAMPWEEYKQAFGKVFNGPEEDDHKQTYEANVQMIETHNAQGASFTMGINQFTDLTQQQYRVAAGLGWMPAPTEGAMPVLKTHIHMGEELADSVDWTTKGALKSGSEQQLVDCSKFPNMGCSGGNPSIAVGFETKHNVCSEESYPYTAAKGSCKGDTSCSAIIPSGGVTGYNNVGATKTDFKSAVQQQPVTIAIEADQS